MSENDSRRRQSIPVLYTRGTHYEVGLDMGRTFSGIIKEFLQVSTGLNQTLLPAYNTPEGKRLYEASLSTVETSFPQYVRELEGIAEGADVEFYKLFLLHLGSLLTTYIEMTSFKEDMQCITAKPATTGCLNVIVNNYYNRYIAHTQDATEDMLNYSYFVVAHIVNETPQGKHGVTEERFMSFCYAGQLPGFAMSSNQHGIVYAINKLMPCTVGIGKTPPHFLGRALLSAENMEQVAFILGDEGYGAADGFSLSVASINDRLKKCFIIEVAPAIIGAISSQLNIVEIQPGSHSFHGNMYQELEVNELANAFLESTRERLEAVSNYEPPKTKENVLDIMSDGKIFLEGSGVDQELETVVLGLFDLSERTLSVYINRPSENEPLFVMPLILKSNCRIFER